MPRSRQTCRAGSVMRAPAQPEQGAPEPVQEEQQPAMEPAQEEQQPAMEPAQEEQQMASYDDVNFNSVI